MEKQLKEIIRSVIREEFISELSKNDVHVKEIMKFYDKGTYSTKKAVSIFVSGKPNATRNQILDDLGDMGYNDVWEVMDHFKLTLESVNEKLSKKDIEKLTSYKDLSKFIKLNKSKISSKDFMYIEDEVEALKYLESDYKRGKADRQEVEVAVIDAQDSIKKVMGTKIESVNKNTLKWQRKMQKISIKLRS
jgi:undecaprenyl pyrophosphate synthase